MRFSLVFLAFFLHHPVAFPEPDSPLPLLDVDLTFPPLPVYARVRGQDVLGYASAQDAAAGLNPTDAIPSGMVYYSLDWHGIEASMVEPGLFVRASDLAVARPSEFHGLAFADTPDRAFGWVTRRTVPSRTPGGPVDTSAAAFARYDVVQVFESRRVDSQGWIRVGTDEWLPRRSVGLVNPVRDPLLPSRGKWISVNLAEQTVAAYEDGQLVFASLVSTGYNFTPTHPGVFPIYTKLEFDELTGSFLADRSDYYSLDDVPRVMYFDENRGFHGVYWHDDFGTARSHGCVNLSLADAHWLFEWAELGTWVHVFDPRLPAPRPGNALLLD